MGQMEPHTLRSMAARASVRAPLLDETGGQLYYLSDVTGSEQLWRLAGPRRWPRRCTFFDSGVRGATPGPASDRIVGSTVPEWADTPQLFVYDMSTGNCEFITDASGSDHYLGSWSPSGDQFAFVSNRGYRYSIFRQSLEGGQGPERIHDLETTATVCDWSGRDDLLFKQSIGNLKQELHVLDIESGETDHLTADLPDARYTATQWSASGRSVHLVTDAGADRLYAATLDVETGELAPTYRPERGCVDAVQIDESTGTAMLFRNDGGYSTLLLGTYGEEGLSVSPVDALPAGVISSASLTPDGRTVVMTVSTVSEPPDVYTLDVGDRTVERWTGIGESGPELDSTVRTRATTYRSPDGTRVPTLVSHAGTEGTMPVFVDVHGGPTTQRRPGYRPLRRCLLAEGWLVVEPNVRGSTGNGREYALADRREGRERALADLRAVVRGVLEERDEDPSEVVAFGQSYGGLVVLNSLADTDGLWSRGVVVSSITDLAAYVDSANPVVKQRREREYGSLSADAGLIERLNPVEQVESIDCPVLVVHGESDTTIPADQSRSFESALAETGTDVSAMYIEDAGHGVRAPDHRARLCQRVLAFARDG